MKPLVHKFILPPVLVGLHALLLLPLFFAPPPEHLGNPQHELLQSHSSDGSEREPLMRRLHLKDAIPIGVVGFVGVHVLRRLAGMVPLPKDPRRTRLAARIEKGVLFALGVVEEVWRWGLVRLLIKAIGGKGGFRGRGELWGLSYVGLAGEEETFAVARPSIWEAVYLMGWIWSAVETVLAWYTVRPTHPDELHHSYNHYPHSGYSRRNIDESRNSPRRQLLGKRTRSDYSTMVQSDAGSDHEPTERRTFFETIQHKRRDLGSSPRARERPELKIQFVLEGSGSTTACDESIRNCSATPTTPKAFGKAVEMERGETTPRATFAVPPRHDGISDNDYGDDEGSDSESESGLSSRSSCDGTRRGYSETQTPLLSSSLPYDPEQDHPHHEHLPHRQASFSTLGEPTALVALSSVAGDTDHVLSSDSEDGGLVVVHEDDVDASDSDEAPTPIERPHSPRRRIYPSFPSYSASYNHTHFPALAPALSENNETQLPTPTAPLPVPAPAPVRHHSVRRRVYGLSVDRLPVYLAIMWRAAALLRHLGHSMWFAWAPVLVFQGHLQCWCVLVLGVLAVRKGWNTVEWFGGSASRAGLLKSSAVLLTIGTIIYIGGLVVWGLLY